MNVEKTERIFELSTGVSLSMILLITLLSVFNVLNDNITSLLMVLIFGVYSIVSLTLMYFRFLHTQYEIS